MGAPHSKPPSPAVAPAVEGRLGSLPADWLPVALLAGDAGLLVRRCGVVVGNLSAAVPLESILASHALAHAAEGRLYQEALLDGAQASGLDPIAVARASIWDEACWSLGVSVEELKRRIGDLRREVGAPWAEDQKLAALAALLALAAPA